MLDAHHRLVAAPPPGRDRWRGSALVVAGVHRVPRGCRSTPSPTPRRCRCRSTPSRRRSSPLEIERQITVPVEQAHLRACPGSTRCARSPVRPVAGHASSSRTAPTSTSPARSSPSGSRRVELPAGHRAARARPGRHRPRRGLPLPRHRRRHVARRAAHRARLDHQAAAALGAAASPRSTPGAATSGRSRSSSTRASSSKHGLTLDELVEALEQNNRNVGGGTLDAGRRVEPRPGRRARRRSLDDIEAIVVAAHDGVPIRVGDVAEVVEGHEIRRGAVTADGKGEVVLGLGFMLMGENSHDVTRAARSCGSTRSRRRLPDGRRGRRRSTTAPTLVDQRARTRCGTTCSRARCSSSPCCSSSSATCAPG